MEKYTGLRATEEKLSTSLKLMRPRRNVLPAKTNAEWRPHVITTVLAAQLQPKLGHLTPTCRNTRKHLLEM